MNKSRVCRIVDREDNDHTAINNSSRLGIVDRRVTGKMNDLTMLLTAITSDRVCTRDTENIFGSGSIVLYFVAELLRDKSQLTLQSCL